MQYQKLREQPPFGWCFFSLKYLIECELKRTNCFAAKMSVKKFPRIMRMATKIISSVSFGTQQLLRYRTHLAAFRLRSSFDEILCI